MGPNGVGTEFFLYPLTTVPEGDVSLGTQALTPPVKARLRVLAGNRVTSEGALLIAARNHRTQEGNRREALERLMDLIARASIEPKKRRPTRPTLGSKQRRLEGKQERKRTKQLRGRVTHD